MQTKENAEKYPTSMQDVIQVVSDVLGMHCCKSQTFADVCSNNDSHVFTGIKILTGSKSGD
jgi:hypothetical protein